MYYTNIKKQFAEDVLLPVQFLKYFSFIKIHNEYLNKHITLHVLLFYKQVGNLYVSLIISASSKIIAK